MNDARAYILVVLLHVCADIVFAASLLMMTVVATLLSREPLSAGASADKAARHRRLAVGVRRWNRFVAGPSLVLVWLLGLWLAHRAGFFAAGWLHAKIALVLFVSALHGWVSGALRRYVRDTSVPIPRAIWLTIPLSLAGFAAIVWLVLLKPS